VLLDGSGSWNREKVWKIIRRALSPGQAWGPGTFKDKLVIRTCLLTPQLPENQKLMGSLGWFMESPACEWQNPVIWGLRALAPLAPCSCLHCSAASWVPWAPDSSSFTKFPARAPGSGVLDMEHSRGRRKWRSDYKRWLLAGRGGAIFGTRFIACRQGPQSQGLLRVAAWSQGLLKLLKIIADSEELQFIWVQFTETPSQRAKQKWKEHRRI
jgi:hypothetical protein